MDHSILCVYAQAAGVLSSSHMCLTLVVVPYRTMCVCSGDRYLYKLNRSDDLSVW